MCEICRSHTLKDGRKSYEEIMPAIDPDSRPHLRACLCRQYGRSGRHGCAQRRAVRLCGWQRLHLRLRRKHAGERHQGRRDRLHRRLPHSVLRGWRCGTAQPDEPEPERLCRDHRNERCLCGLPVSGHGVLHFACGPHEAVRLQPGWRQHDHCLHGQRGA